MQILSFNILYICVIAIAILKFFIQIPCGGGPVLINWMLIGLKMSPLNMFAE